MRSHAKPSRRMHWVVMGIDLAGSERRNTGICVMDERRNVKTWIVHTDKEIVELVKEYMPEVIAIDAPLSLPKGRKRIDEKCDIHFRLCDLELRKRGIKFFPITLGPMRMLTRRGIELKKKLQQMGFEVIEVYPGATQDLFGLPRKQQGLERLKKGLERLGVKGLKDVMSGDELDAITAALTAILYLEGKCEEIGDPSEGLMVIPKVKRKHSRE